MKLDLGQCFDLHRQQGRKVVSFGPKDGGEFEVALYGGLDHEAAVSDPGAWRRGKRVWRETHHNQMTGLFRERIVTGDGVKNSYVMIFSDRKPIHKYGEFRRTTNPSAGYAFRSSFIANASSRLWTVTGTILAPAAGKTRNFKTVGLITDDPPVTWPSGNNSHGSPNLIAATLLSADRDQDDTQQVVVSYRLAWEVPSDV